MKQYDEIMSKIVVTEEMKMRILKNIGESDVITKSENNMVRCHAAKKYLSVAACLVLLLAGVIAIPRFLTPDHDNQPNIMAPGSDIITVSSSEELADTVGFELFYLAVWNMNGFSYSVGVRNGIDETAFTDIIDSIISK